VPIPIVVRTRCSSFIFAIAAVTRTLLAAVLAASLALPAVAQASGYYASPPHYPDAAAAEVTICRLRVLEGPN
jgi:hypothetical protein